MIPPKIANRKIANRKISQGPKLYMHAINYPTYLGISQKIGLVILKAQNGIPYIGSARAVYGISVYINVFTVYRIIP